MRHSELAARLQGRRGQSVVEFALVLPLMVVLMVSIIDLARIYTTILTIESAAREAADFGTFGSYRWDPAVVTAPDGTAAKMRYRACVAASDLPDYEGPDDNCVNPGFDYDLSTDKGASWVEDFDGSLGCDNPTKDPPCWVRVTLEYEFRLLVPFQLEAFGTQFGLPQTLTFSRSSIFAMTDLELGP